METINCPVCGKSVNTWGGRYNLTSEPIFRKEEFCYRCDSCKIDIRVRRKAEPNPATIEKIVDYMVGYGTANTESGTMCFYSDTLADILGIDSSYFKEFYREIIDGLEEREEVAEVDYDGVSDAYYPPLDSFEFYFDIVFYMNYCPNIPDEDRW